MYTVGIKKFINIESDISVVKKNRIDNSPPVSQFIKEWHIYVHK